MGCVWLESWIKKKVLVGASNINTAYSAFVKKCLIYSCNTEN